MMVKYFQKFDWDAVCPEDLPFFKDCMTVNISLGVHGEIKNEVGF